MTGEFRSSAAQEGQRQFGKYALLSAAMIVFTACLALSISKIFTRDEVPSSGQPPYYEAALMADRELQRLRHSFDVYALGGTGSQHGTLSVRLQRAQRSLEELAREVPPGRAQNPAAPSPRWMAEELAALGPELLAFERSDETRGADLSARLDSTAMALHQIVTDARAVARDHEEQAAQMRWRHLEQALYLLGMLASGGVFIGMLLHESRRTRRLLAEATSAQVRIEHLAHHDPLTDLPNRWLFKDRLDQALRLAQRQGIPVALHCIDIDFFKTVNDRYGHVTGDQLLVAVARRMQGCLRESDTLARLGGDEFAIVQSGPTALGAEPLAERLLKAFRVPLAADGHKLKATLSIGIGLYPEHAVSADTLHRAADAALYRAKTAGRDQYHIWRPGDDHAGFPVRRALAG